MRLYVASSWKNPIYPSVVLELRAKGNLCYDFRDANRSFNWAEIDPSWDAKDPVLSSRDLKRALASAPATKAFHHDKSALDWCDGAVLVMPSGRSAHLEAGYLIGKGKPVAVLLSEGERPDLMHLLGQPCDSLAEAMDYLAGFAMDHSPNPGGNLVKE